MNDDGRSEQLRAHARLVQDGTIGGARGNHRNKPTALGQAARNPHQPGELVLLCIGRDSPYCGAHLRVRMGHEHTPRARIQHRRDDLRSLIGRLALAKDRLRSSLTQLAVEIELGEPQLAKRQRGEPAKRIVGIDPVLAHVLEQGRELVVHPRHERQQ